MQVLKILYMCQLVNTQVLRIATKLIVSNCTRTYKMLSWFKKLQEGAKEVRPGYTHAQTESSIIILQYFARTKDGSCM